MIDRIAINLGKEVPMSELDIVSLKNRLTPEFIKQRSSKVVDIELMKKILDILYLLESSAFLRLQDILKQVGGDKTTVNRNLYCLLEIGYVEKESPSSARWKLKRG